MSSADTRTSRENRVHPRVHVEVAITLFSDSQLYTALSQNLSEGGVFVCTYALRKIGERVDLTMSFPNSESVRTAGEVRWVREFSDRIDSPPGMGVRFVSLGEKDIKTIRKFLHARDPLLFEE